MYGILRLINFAHGDVFMVAGLIMVYLTGKPARRSGGHPAGAGADSGAGLSHPAAAISPCAGAPDVGGHLG